MSSLALLVLLLVQSSGAATESLSGRVVGEDGLPIEGVRLATQGSRSNATTDSDGRFSVTLTKFSVLGEWSTVRFSRDGYRPLTRQLTTPNPVITLSKQDESAWKIPACSGRIQLQGFMMGFQLPKGSMVESPRGFDNFIAIVSFKKYRMRLGFGFNWSSGFPFPSQLHELRTMSERDVIFEGDVSGVEYRGVRTNGTYYRFIGKEGETIEYDKVPKETADYFDGILDSLCSTQRDFSGKKP